MDSLRFNPKDNAIVVEAKISADFIATTRLVFDTGASLVMIPWRIATKLNIDIDPKQVIQTTTASTVESSPLVTIPKITVLGHTLKNIEGLVKDLPAEAGVDELLGLSFIKHFNVIIDFQKGVLKLERFRH